jgi:hypothetical protein
MGQLATIYALRDPRTSEIRYIGRTVESSLQRRVNGHLADRLVNHRTKWLAGLKSLDQKPIIESLMVVSRELATPAECYVIAIYKSLGFRLVNATDGGEGMLNASPETRQKLSAANKGRIHTPKARANMRQAAQQRTTQYKHSNDTIIKLKTAKKDFVPVAATAQSRLNNKARTHCIHGHEFTPENTRITNLGHRDCRTCRKGIGRRADARRYGKSPILEKTPRTYCKRGHKLSPENVAITPQGERRCRLCRAFLSQQHRERRRSQ